MSLITGAATAQSSSSDIDGYPKCKTNSGVPGAIFQGYFGTLQAPRNFVSLTLDDGEDLRKNGHIETFPSIMYRQEMLVIASPHADNERITAVHFVDAFGRTKSSCELTVIPFASEKHDFAGTRIGYCRFGRGNGPSRLMTGEDKEFDLPEQYREGSTSPTKVLRHSPEVGARQVRFKAQAEGYATFVWIGKDTGNGILKGVCPFVVSNKP